MTYTCITLDINFENNCTKTWLERLGAKLRGLFKYHGCFNEEFLVDSVTCNVLLNDKKRERKH